MHANDNISKQSYSYKYITIINGKQTEILSDLKQDDVMSILVQISKKFKTLKQFEILDCIEFQYTNTQDVLTLEDLIKYL